MPHKKVRKAETSQLSHRSLFSKCKQPVQVFTNEASQWTSSTRPFYCSRHRPRAPLAMFHTCWVRLDLQQSEIGTSMGKQVSDVDEASEESFLFFVNNQCVGFAVPETLPPKKIFWHNLFVVCLFYWWSNTLGGFVYGDIHGCQGTQWKQFRHA